MKRIVGFIVLITLLLGAFILPAAAAPTADLNVLASYFPTKTTILFSFRTDDGYRATLQTVIDRINQAVRSADLPNLEAALDEAIADSGMFDDEANFSTEVRSWLGDVASFGTLSLDVLANDSRRDDDEVPALFAVQITDRAAAEAFFETALPGLEAQTLGNYNVYTVDERPLTQIAIGDDVLFVSNDAAALPFEGAPSSSLGANTLFIDTLALLPAVDYNMTAYLQIRDVYAAMLTNNPAMAQVSQSSFMGLVESIPPIALGATVIDERSLTLDVALETTELLAAFEAQGMVYPINPPLDPSFLERVPAGVPLVIHGNNLQGAYQQLVTQFRAQAEMMTNMMGDNADAGITAQQVEQGISAATIAIQGVTGLNLQDELLPALTGDYALYLGLGEALQDEDADMMSIMSAFPLEFGWVIRLDDPSLVPTLVEGVTNALGVLPAQSEDGTEITVGSDTIAGSDVTTVTIVTEDSPFPIELVVGGDEDVFFIGTPASARASLNPDGGLLTDSDYQAAVATMLESPSLVYYLGGAGLQPLATLAPFLLGQGSGTELRDFMGVLSLLGNGSISYSYTDNAMISRFVLTLAE